jgi:hypothetical protein
MAMSRAVSTASDTTEYQFNQQELGRYTGRIHNGLQGNTRLNGEPEKGILSNNTNTLLSNVLEQQNALNNTINVQQTGLLKLQTQADESDVKYDNLIDIAEKHINQQRSVIGTRSINHPTISQKIKRAYNKKTDEQKQAIIDTNEEKARLKIEKQTREIELKEEIARLKALPKSVNIGINAEKRINKVLEEKAEVEANIKPRMGSMIDIPNKKKNAMSAISALLHPENTEVQTVPRTPMTAQGSRSVISHSLYNRLPQLSPSSELLFSRNALQDRKDATPVKDRNYHVKVRADDGIDYNHYPYMPDHLSEDGTQWTDGYPYYGDSEDENEYAKVAQSPAP